MNEHLAPDPEAPLRRQTALAHFGGFALRSDDLPAILGEACRIVGRALGTDLAKVLEIQPDRRTLVLRAGVGWREELLGQPVSSAADGSSDDFALRAGGPVISRDAAEEDRFVYPAFVREHGVRAMVNVLIPGVADADPYGILEVDSLVPRDCSAEDAAFLQTYANMLGAAVTRRRIEQRLRETVRERERLLREFQHRVKNNLQVVTSLVQLQARRTKHEEARRELRGIRDRIEALRIVHDKLYSAGAVDRVDLGGYLSELSASLMRFHAEQAAAVRLRTEAERVVAPPETAVPLGMVAAEFITNSLKYAFEPAGGTIGMVLERIGDEQARLTLWDDGRGLPRERAGGTGMALVGGLCEQAGGQARWSGEAGTRLTVEFPCPRSAERWPPDILPTLGGA